MVTLLTVPACEFLYCQKYLSSRVTIEKRKIYLEILADRF